MGDAEGTREPRDSVETKRGASVSREQLQRDYDAAGGLRQLSAMYGISYDKARRMLVDAGVEIKKRGSNGANHSEAWYDSQRRYREEHPGRYREQIAKAHAARWETPEQHQRQSERMQANWDDDPEWRERHAETLRRGWDGPDAPFVAAWDNPDRRERQRRIWLQRIEVARGGHGDARPGEENLHDALMRASISFTANAVVLGGRYIADVLVRQRPLIIEADGASHRMPGAAERDAQRTADLEAAGFAVARFTYRQLQDDADGCVASLGLQAEENPVHEIISHGAAMNQCRYLRDRW